MKTRYLLLLVALPFVGSCEKDELTRYEEANHAVVFPGLGDALQYPGYNQDGSGTYLVTFSFLSVAVGTPSAVATLPVRVVGVAAPHDREVGVKILETGTTAAADQYRFVKAVIPANETYGTIEIEVDYADDLTTEERVICLELVSSDDLTVGPREYAKGKLVWHCKLLRPATSATIRTYNHLIAGEAYRTTSSFARNTYSSAAHRLILTVTGWETLPSYSAAPYYVYTNYPAYRKKIQDYLDAWNAAHPGDPLVHDGGALVGQPIAVRVD
ncbi:MAG: DUF4843 domain-containing protein [Odoribacteraceae bacterium]|jgi:hypothetical protein|nr:DUF4843 domain-containing protein [Odoribacteraceae bacterium]